MAVRPVLDTLLFVDTNILLDFYRIRKSDVSTKYLEQLEACKDRLIADDELPGLTQFKDKNFEVAPGQYTLFDVNKNFPLGGSAIITVKNAATLQGKIVLTKDGYLVYQAPSIVGEETIILEIAPESGGEAAEAKVKMAIKNLPTGTGDCYRNLDFFLISANASVTITPEMILKNDTTCGNTPTGDVEILFTPRELPYTQNGNQITVNSSPGGIDFDGFLYKGTYANQDSAYLGFVFLTNQAGCTPWPIDDIYEIKASPDSAYYTLDILANDQLCDYPLDSVSIGALGFTSTPKGTAEIINNRFIRYYPPAGATLPLTVSFDGVWYVRKRNGSGSTGFYVYLTLKP